MLNPTTAVNWMLVVSALPPALAVFLALFGQLLLHHLTASNPDPYLRHRDQSNLSFCVIALSWVFSVAVGCVVLLINGVLIIKGSVSLRQWRVAASVALAAADVFIPVGLLALFVIVARGIMKWL